MSTEEIPENAPLEVPLATHPEVPPTTIALDSRAIQVLAHPLRSRLLSTLRIDGPGTATALAATLGTNSGATSYHLRKLSEVGLVIDTEDGRGKERRWRAASDRHSWRESEFSADPNAAAARSWLQSHYFDEFVQRYSEWIARQSEAEPEWQDAATGSDWLISASPRQLMQLQEEIAAVLERYQEPDAAPEADVRAVAINLYAYPRVNSRADSRLER